MSSETLQRPRRTLADIAHNEVTAWLVLALSLLLTAAAWQISTLYVERRALERFQYEVEDAKFAIAKRMQEYEQTLRGGVALFDAVGRRVTRQEWHTFVGTLNIEKYFPGLQGIGFAQWIAPAERAAVIAGVRADGYPDFTIKPEGERQEYTSILYLEPMDARNLRAFGYDMYSEPTRRAAMAHARDAGEASVSGRVVLLQETEQDVQAGFLMYLPVYHPGMPAATVAQRRAALLGFVYSPYRIVDLMRGILGQGPPGLDFQIYDGLAVGPDALLFDTEKAWRDPQRDYARRPAYTAQEAIDLPGRTWTVVFSSRANFEAAMSSNQPELVAMGGLAVDLLLFAIIWSLSQQRKRVLVKAGEMTSELRRSREQFRAITDTAHDVIVSTDADGRIIYCNPAASHAFGVPAAQLLGRSVTALMPEQARIGQQPGLRALLEQGATASVRVTFEAVGLRVGGERFPLEVSLSNWRADDETCFTLLMRDITERKRIDRLKDEFVSTVSHELRTPLTAIRGALGLLHAGGAGGAPLPQSAALISIAHQNTERLVRLVNDILDLEKLQSGQMILELQQVPLSPLLAQAVTENRPLALSQQVSLALAQPLPQIAVQADPGRLMQVLGNLISNAVKFSPAGGTVTLSAVLAGGAVRVSVADTGPGIPDNFSDRVFQRFSQADASDSRSKGGSGLGLSICKSIIDLHGGEIGYESGPETGACFYFELAVESRIAERA